MKILDISGFVSERLEIKPVDLTNLKNLLPFGLTKGDLSGKLAGFPMGVVVRMMEEQQKQGNEPDVSVFQERGYDLTDSIHGGFDWIVTEGGQCFWEDVLRDRKFNVFFEIYPEYEKYNLD